MSRTFDFFSNINDFKEIVPGVEASTTLTEMQASFERAAQIIKDMISEALWTSLKTAYLQPTTDEKKKTAIPFLQGAIGNRTYYHHLIFKVVGKKKEQIGFYKSEIHAMEETYLDNFAAYMDKLLQYLDDNTADFTGWSDTETYKLRQKLLIKSASAFSKYCQLGNSVYFFMLTIPLQLEVIDTDIASRKITAATYAGKEPLERNIMRFVAYKTASMAISQLESPDLPRSIRNDVYNESSRSSGSNYQEKLVKEKIADLFNNKAERYLELINIEMTQPDQDAGESTDIYFPGEDLFTENDNYYFPG